MKIITKSMSPYDFDIREAMEIGVKRAGNIEDQVAKAFSDVVKMTKNMEMGTIIVECLNKIPVNAKEAVWTTLLIVKYEEMARRGRMPNTRLTN